MCCDTQKVYTSTLSHPCDRSLGVTQPFATARENLLLLFEKNRTRYGQQAQQLVALAARGGASGVCSRVKGIRFEKYGQKAQQLVALF